MTEREQFEAWAREYGYDVDEPYDPAHADAWLGWNARAARAQTAQAVPASCGECGKKTSDGWALYCVACMEKAGLLGGTSSPPLTHSCTSSLVRTADSTAQAVPLLTDDPLFVFAQEVIHGAYKPDELKDAAMRAIRHHSAVRAKMGVAVPMTSQDHAAALDEAVDDGSVDEVDMWAFINGIKAAEKFRGIVGKEGA